MKRLLLSLVVFILAGLGFAACRGGVQPSPTVEPRTPAMGVTTPAPGAGSGEKWNSILTEAKKEGSVAVYTIWGSPIRTALTQAFKEKYGINLEATPFSRGADLLAKVQAEKRAGLYLADVFGAGNATLLSTMKPEGLLGSVKPLFILPEVLDPNAWRGGKVPFTDEEGLALSLIGALTRYVVYNTDLIKEGEISSYKDLLKPQYKGKIIMTDPSITGAGAGFLAHLGHGLWGEAETGDFFRRLVREQEVLFNRDPRLHIESVARGKYAIAVAPTADVFMEFLALGAPIKSAMVKEDTRLTASSGALGVPTKLAHPNATIVFLNWLLTREGQSVFARTFRQPSTRLDASTEGLNPLYVPVPGEKYFLDTQEFLIDQGRWTGISKRIMEEALK